ncbi:MAG: type II secretion system F family protein [Thaumarchaeota archaeon]|nr:type II secretion system F family protein [Nitrososphaerota archaeon]
MKHIMLQQKEAMLATGYKPTFFDRYTSISYKIFQNPAKRLSLSMPKLRDDILKSNLHITPEGVVATAFLTALISLGVSTGIVIGGLYTGLFGPVLLSILPLIFFLPPILALYSPKMSQSSRASALDHELPFVMGFMVVLAGGGVPPLGVLRRLINMKFFPAAAKEAKRILVDIDVFGLDPISAMEKAAKYNPNKFFSEFLYGYTTVLKTGGDFVAYLSAKLSDVFQTTSVKIKRASETIALLAEGFVAVTALLGITLFTLYQVQSLLSPGSGGLETIMAFSFIGVPALSGLFIFLIDGVQPKQPYVDLRAVKVFLASIPIGITIYLLPLGLVSYLHVSLALMSMVIAPSILSIKYSAERRGLEKMLPDFIQDVSQGRKIGLAPEKSIETLSSENYSRLSKHVKKMGAQLSWGVSLSKVVTTITSAVSSWLTKVVGTLMIEVVDIGGGTVKSFIEMATFTRRINDMESEKRSSLRPYIFVTYVAAMMVIITTFMMVFFMTQPLTASMRFMSARQTTETVNQLLTASIFQGWVIGLVAGKMGEGSVSDGFKHSLALVLISLAMIYMSGSFVKLP